MSRAPLPTLRQPKRIRPREQDVEDLPWPTTSDCIRAVLRSVDPRRTDLYQRVVDRRVREAQSR